MYKNLKLCILLVGMTLGHADANVTEEQNISVATPIGETKDIIVSARVSYGEYPSTVLVSPFKGFYTVIDIDTTGVRTLLLPNEKVPDTYVEANTTIDVLKEENIKNNISIGLHYVMVVFSEKRFILSMSIKDKITFDAFKDDKHFNKVLEELQAGKFGKYIFKMLPVYK